MALAVPLMTSMVFLALLPACTAVPLPFLHNTYLPDLAADFSGGAATRDVPEKVKAFLYRELTQLVPELAVHTTLGEGVGSPLWEDNGPHRLFSLMAAPSNPPVGLPDPQLVFDRLLKRQGSQAAGGVNFLHASFIGWVLQHPLGELRTANDTRSPRFGGLGLSMVYGTSPERKALLRREGTCLLRTSTTENGEEVALMWKDVGRGGTDGFVLGDDSLGSHWGHVLWCTVFTLEHNRLCRAMEERYPSGAKDALFERVRVLLHLAVRRIVLEEVAGALSPAPLPRMRFDHRQCPLMKASHSPLYAELDALRVEALLPTHLAYSEETVPLHAVLANSSGFARYRLAEHVKGFLTTMASRPSPRSIPQHYRTEVAEALERGRAFGVERFNTYWKLHGHRRMESFSDLTDDPSIAAELRGLYKTVDDVDLLVGLLVQGTADPVPPLMKYMLYEHLLPLVYSPSVCGKAGQLTEYLTPDDLRYVYETDSPLRTMLQQHGLVGEGEGRDTVLCTMEELAISNIADYAGMNELWGVVLDDEYHGGYYAMVVVGSSLLLFTATGMYWLRDRLHRYAERHGIELQEKGKGLLFLYLLTAMVYTLQVPVYTVVALYLLFSCRFDLAITTYFLALMYLSAAHLFLYVIDIFARLLSGRMNRMLVTHHLVWAAVLFAAGYFRDIFAFRIAVVLDYFSTFEFGLFFLLFYSKLHARSLSPCAIILGRTAVAIFVLTRFLQFALLAYYFSATFSRMSTYGYQTVWFTLLVLVLTLMVAQTYTVYEYSKWKVLWGSPPDNDVETESAPYGCKTKESDGSPAHTLSSPNSKALDCPV